MSNSDPVPRILAHMNKDHAHNLEDYLVVFGHVDETAASRNPTMESLTLDGFTVSFTNATNNSRTLIKIPFEPSLETYTDAKTRLVQLAQTAAKRRGFSEYIVNEVPYFDKPANVIVTIILAFVFFFVAMPTQLSNFLNLLNLSDSVKDKIQGYIAPVLRILIAIHSIEAILILYPLIRKHRMGFFNKLAALGWTMIQGVAFISAYKRAINRASSPRKKD
ncbi:hypothetical protein CANINC_000314 [Pichia inconspicua]|uniref:DUF2470 domain-containing protein n=1 Tax=Pichia inconspicua TaxID=52247 RepID=A0A4V4NG90_9ASCO|nr:hypothetical protein CANINC_000314 [[Candida] inconspicua]